MTLKEIAALAEVSPSTVSRVINHSKKSAASKTVQDKIWEIVRTSGYTPNSTARNLRLGFSQDITATNKKTIACIFARSSTTRSSLFFSQISRAVEQEALKSGYIIKYSFSAYDLDDKNVKYSIENQQVDGAVVLGRFDNRLMNFLTEHYKFIVYTGLNDIDAKFDRIICDGYQISIAAVHYLAKLGHTQIAYLGEKTKECRYRGYCAALQQEGFEFDRKLVVNTPLSPDGGYSGTKELFKRNVAFSAIFCANDSTAIGAMKAIKDQGLSIPDDISVMGIDDIETAQYVTPMLSTVHIPMDELGRMAVKMLVDRIENGKRIPLKVELPFTLAIRESCSYLKNSPVTDRKENP